MSGLHQFSQVLDVIDQTKKTGTTVLMVTHNVDCCSRADNIVVLSSGSVEEAGSHQALLDKKGKYWDFYKHSLA